MYNILVCDDEKDIVSAIKIYFEAEGYKVFTAENGKEALSIVAKEDIQIVQRLGSRVQSSITSPANSQQAAPLEAGTVVGRLTYDDKDLVGQGYVTSDRPSFDMVAEKNVEKAFFLKIWWNSFVRYVNEKL